MKENQTNGCYKNLENQVNDIMKNCNESSIRTRYRYLEATKRCCDYLSAEYKLQKFSNLSSKHLISYVEHMKEQGLSAATIKTEIAGIRYFHRHSGSKNILIDNSKLDLMRGFLNLWAQYYSKSLAVNVKRGMNQNVDYCYFSKKCCRRLL